MATVHPRVAFYRAVFADVGVGLFVLTLGNIPFLRRRALIMEYKVLRRKIPAVRAYSRLPSVYLGVMEADMECRELQRLIKLTREELFAFQRKDT